MKSSKTSGMLGVFALASIVSPLAMANQSGWYGGGNVGQSSVNIDDERIISGLLGNGFTTTSITDDDRDLGYKVFGGYQFNRHVSLEGGYFDLGKFGFNAITQPPGTLSGSIKLKGINLDIVGTLPITKRLSAFGRAGVNYAEAKATFVGTGAANVLSPNRQKRDTNYKFGLGLQYDFTQYVGMRIEAERYRIDDAVGNKGDVDLISAGLVFRFGAKTPAAQPRISPPEPVVAAAPPAPAVMPPPAPRPALVRTTFSASSLFDFDSATVKPQGKQTLDAFSAELRNVRFDVITVTGHTDRLGSHAYNLELSLRRAEAVKDYLMTSTGIASNRITARGVNGAEPVTLPGQCLGERRTQALIACLQPDRRVEIDVTGTQ